MFLPPWGKSEQWTLSAQHTVADADRFVANVERMTSELALLDSWMPDPTTTASSRSSSPLARVLGDACASRRSAECTWEVRFADQNGDGGSGRRRNQAGAGTLRRWGRLKADSAMPSSIAAAART